MIIIKSDIIKFFKKIVVVSLLVLLSMYLIELSLRRIPNNYSYKKSFLDKNAVNIEVLILGNSHAYRGIIADSLPFNSFNAAYIAQSIDLDAKILEKYRDSLNDLRFLVMNISYHSLHRNLERTKENYRLKNYLLYYDLPVAVHFKNRFEFFASNATNRWEDMYNYYIHGISNKSCFLKGSEPLTRKRDLKVTAKKAAQRHTVELNNNDFIQNMEIISDIVKWTENNDVKLIFVSIPVSQYYVNSIDFNQYSTTVESLNILEQKYDHVYYLNNFESKDFFEVDFMDGDHLNLMGAKKHTKAISNYINMILKNKE